MQFNSLGFMLFFPIVVLLYFLIPQRLRHIWLLLSSYYFYMCWNVQYALLMLFSTGVTYLSGRLMDWVRKQEWSKEFTNRRLKYCVAGSLILNLSIIFFYKYFDFAFDNLSSLLALIHIQLNRPTVDVLLPVGISFYTFQALSYTMDVYREEIPVERSFLRYALFVSFFPQLVAGPIERSKNLLEQFYEEHHFDYQRVKYGLLRMFWGLFMKMVVADRLALLVDQVYDNWQWFGGIEIILATAFFAIQIYCDFGSYSNIAIGAAQVMGFRLMDNFHQPYFAVSVADFWRRWHISLTSWFRDYLYIPLGGNRKGKFRKYMNLMIVFLVSGLWHGASWHYVVWGGLNGMYQIIGDMTSSLRERLQEFFGLDKECFSYRLLQQIVTFVLVDFTWLFFRTDGLKTAFHMLKQIATKLDPIVLIDGSLFSMGLDEKNFIVVLLSIGILWLVDLYNYRGESVRLWLDKQLLIFRWGIYYALLFAIIIFGVYGLGYDATAFIYFQF